MDSTFLNYALGINIKLKIFQTMVPKRGWRLLNRVNQNYRHSLVIYPELCKWIACYIGSMQQRNIFTVWCCQILKLLAKCHPLAIVIVLSDQILSNASRHPDSNGWHILKKSVAVAILNIVTI